MKIMLTGGGTGGHFYPLIAVAQEIKQLIEEKKLIEPKFYLMADNAYNQRVLYENNIEFVPVSAGKMRHYISIQNIIDIFRTGFGIIEAIWKMYRIYPDVVFSKGGYASFPALWAARILNIPIVIHDSDSIPGRVSKWSGKFAKRIALSYPDAAKYFNENKTAVVGTPLRREILHPFHEGAHEFLGLEPGVPIIFIVGGSQGALALNEVLIDILPELLENYQVIHQVGKKNLDSAEKRTKTILSGNRHASRYKLFDYLNETALRMTAGVAELVITRAGSMLYEIAHWDIPAIIIPIPEEIAHDQRTNALTYAASGAAIVIEEKNLTPSILLSEINRVFTDETLLNAMKTGAKAFARPEAGRLIADEILNIALTHES